jgi:hypothetical protein
MQCGVSASERGVSLMWSRLFHRWRAHRYTRLAERLQRDLTDYVLYEESRITRLLHRAGWHFTQAQRSRRSLGQRNPHIHAISRAGLRDAHRLANTEADESTL